ncbi:zona pellucida sperm-binding protein 3-like [Pholidichthys leucotaenia]
MGYIEAVLFVLFFSGGDFGFASQNIFNLSANETLQQTPKEQVTSLHLPRSQQTANQESNQVEQSDLVHLPATYQLGRFELREPKSLQLVGQTAQKPQASEGREELEQWECNSLRIPSQVLVKQQQMPIPASSVAVHCGEEKVTIEVKQNFLGNGQVIHPSDLTLEECTAVDTEDDTVRFEVELDGCGSTVTMTEEALIYTFTLKYSPRPIGNTFILKTNPAEVAVQCYYQRRHYVNSNAMRPTWTPFASNVEAEQQLQFSLRLMTEDWQSQRPSSVYFLSEVMHIEAAVIQGHHAPLRVYVDNCVAALSPDPNSQPRYLFISDHGCLTDAKLTGAKSYFMQRSQEDKLHFQLKSFMFHLDDRKSIYITCRLKATTAFVPVDSQHKACSFLTEAKRWVASGGDNEVCSCCETSCSERRQKRSLDGNAALQWERSVVLGPILMQDEELTHPLDEELTEHPPEPVSMLQIQAATPAALNSIVVLLCGVGAVLAAVLVFIGREIFRRVQKPTGHAVCT